MRFSIAVLPGDGIGPEVITESVKVMEAVGKKFEHDFDVTYARVGGNAIDECGTALPKDTMDVCERADAILLGAVGGPKWDDLKAKVRPEDGVLAIRRNLGLFANLRPVKAYPAIVNSTPIKPHLLRQVDLMIVRELTGGLYYARPKRRWRTSRGRRAVDTLRYTEQEIQRILRVGFALATKRSRLLTSVDKANVLESSRLWREIAIEMSQDYPDVQLEHMLVDNAAMQLIRNPSHFDVIVAENTFGDILTDEASVLSGLGMLPSASLTGFGPSSGRQSKTASLYEPIHGSAPDIAGTNVANPIGAILSVAMLLRHSLDLEEEAKSIEQSVDDVLAEGYRTQDIAVESDVVVGTTQMGDFITAKL